MHRELDQMFRVTQLEQARAPQWTNGQVEWFLRFSQAEFAPFRLTRYLLSVEFYWCWWMYDLRRLTVNFDERRAQHFVTVDNLSQSLLESRDVELTGQTHRCRYVVRGARR